MQQGWDERELNFLILHYLASKPLQPSTLSQLEDEFFANDLLPQRRDWTGQPHQIPYRELTEAFPIDPDYLPQLIQKLRPKDALPLKPKRQSTAQFRSPCASSLEVKHLHPLVRLKGHSLPLYFTKFDKTGTRLFTGSDDKLIKVWSSTTGHLLKTLRGHDGHITDLQIDPNNQLLASAGSDKVIRVWAMNNLEPVVVLQGHSKQITCLQFSPSSPLLVSSDYRGEIKFWDTNDWTIKANLVTPCQIWSSAFSTGGECFATGGSDGCIRVWAASTATLIQTLKGHFTVPINTLAWSNRGLSLLAGFYDGTATIWDWCPATAQWTCFAVLQRSSDLDKRICTNVCWSLDDQHVIIALSSTIHVYSTSTARCIHTLSLHSKEVWLLEPHPVYPNLFLSGGYDGVLAFWDIKTGRSVKVFQGPENTQFTSGHFSPLGEFFAAADKNGLFTLYGTGEPYKVPQSQFFLHDYVPLTYDASGWAVDANLNIMPHLIDPAASPLCDEHIVPYLQQPAGLLYTPGVVDPDQLEREQQIRQIYTKAEQYAIGTHPVEEDMKESDSNNEGSFF